MDVGDGERDVSQARWRTLQGLSPQAISLSRSRHSLRLALELPMQWVNYHVDVRSPWAFGNLKLICPAAAHLQVAVTSLCVR